MTIADDEYGWVRLNFGGGLGHANVWKLVRGPNDPTNHGLLSKEQKFWTVSIVGELMAVLPRTMALGEAQNAAKLILLSLKEKDSI